MKLEFEKETCACIRKLSCRTESREETQEVHLGQELPEVGHVIGAWGQVLIRSKEWRTDWVSVGGGVTAQVFYEPEQGGEPVSVPVWIPFQMKWEIPEGSREGTVSVSSCLTALDARSISAGKLMVRSSVSLTPEICIPEEGENWKPGKHPEDLQLLISRYPATIPSEAGEKIFTLDETFPRSETGTILGCRADPVTEEWRILGDKLVFRGKTDIKALYLCPDGTMGSQSFSIPYSQFAELQRDHGEEAQALPELILTSLEWEQEGEGLHVKAGLSQQYRILDRTSLEVVEDAYSPLRTAQPQWAESALPLVLELRETSLDTKAQLAVTGAKIVDALFLPRPAEMTSLPGGWSVRLTGRFRVLYYSPDGSLHAEETGWSQEMALPADPASQPEGTLLLSGPTEARLTGGGVSLSQPLTFRLVTRAGSRFPMACAVELGEETARDPGRPSLILQPAGGESLWNLAKTTGSTVEQIRSLNHLEGEPEAGQWLLIPLT